jgi:DNA polymerase III alpha subunit (gram-positive type)
MSKNTPNRCPACRTGDVISITMNVGGTELEFSTCHECEAKWWVKDGKPVPLTSVLGTVGASR